MTSLLTVVGLIFVIWLMAKYNKNDNLFWILLISLFAGMAGGALVSEFNKERKNDEKTVDFKQVYIPTQVSPAISVDFYTKLGGAQAIMANPVGKEIEIPARDIKGNKIAPSKTSEEIRGQPRNFNPFHLGNPGLPFDTS